MKKILLIADKEGWAYDDAAKHWKEMFKGKYSIDILYLSNYEPIKITHQYIKYIKELQYKKTNPIFNSIFDHNEYDGIYFFYNKALCDTRLLSTPINLNKVGIAINNEKWLNENFEEHYNTYLNGVKIITACNSKILKLFENYNNIYRISQAIDLNIFNRYKERDKNQNFIIGWSGNYKVEIKNFQLAKEACDKAGIPLQVRHNLSRQELNTWYNENVDALLCTSLAEGGPLMLLEAGACKLPIITTPVGIARDIVDDNKNGLFIDYNVDNIIEKLLYLKNNIKIRKDLGYSLFNDVKKNWTYEARYDEVKNMFKELVI